MSERPRLCQRPDCSEPATCTFTYHYGSRTVWLDDLGGEDPGTYDLCLTHGDRLKGPLGWAVEDRRSTILLLRRDIAS